MKLLAFGFLLISQLVFANSNETICGTLKYGNFITEHDGFSVDINEKNTDQYKNITLVHSLESVNLITYTADIVTESSALETGIASSRDILQENQKVCIAGVLDKVDDLGHGIMALKWIRKN